jgi:hypothetical protein
LSQDGNPEPGSGLKLVIFNHEQGTPEWKAARAGNATASEFGSIMAKGEGKTRRAYLRRIVAERLTGKPTETYRNAHMDRGNEQEPFACMAYEARTGAILQKVGFMKHPELAVGCSPDRLIESDGGAEIKSVIPTVQLDTILSGKYPSEHRPQIQGCLWLTRRAWWDFVSYCDDMPQEHLRTYIFRVQREEDYIKTLETEIRGFLREADQVVDMLLGRDNLEQKLRESLARVAA